MRFLVIAYPEDQLAMHVHAELSSRHAPEECRLVPGGELSLSPKVVHRIGDRVTSTTLVLADGTTIDGERLGVVLNRLSYLVMPLFARAKPVDREYAHMETHALWLSVLSSLECPVVNPTSTRGLVGADLGPLEQRTLAHRAGLQPQAYVGVTSARGHDVGDFEAYPITVVGGQAQPELFAVPRMALGRDAALLLEPVGEAVTMLVVKGDVVGPLYRLLGPALAKLGVLSSLPLLEVTLAPARGLDPSRAESWRFCRCSAFPTVVSPASISAVVGLLERVSAQEGAS